MPTKLAVFKAEYRVPVNNDCKGYFLIVTERLKVKVPPGPQADDIIKHICAHWVRIGKGAQDGPTAQDFSKKEYFVVALLSHEKYVHPHKSGHVAIVLPTPTSDYPYVVCGSDSSSGYGKSDGSKKVFEAGHGSPWRSEDAPNIEYYRTPTPVADPEK